ncbi:MAG: helix-turn-helix domain-containing protein, partial [Alphaproteobacteria bacterium]|nr:helix-turn-helix domain-containing protein [Alphaproteobacteria bacterium]
MATRASKTGDRDKTPASFAKSGDAGTAAAGAAGAKDRQFVTALARGLEVLRAFQEGGPLGNQEIARRTGLPKPTVSRLTHTLKQLGYIV